MNEHTESVQRLTRDLVRAAHALTDIEARYLVDAYYIHQEARKRLDNQISAMAAEPHSIIVWQSEQSTIMENQIKRALDVYSENRIIGQWMKAHYGIGPVLAAGLIAHIDIREAPTAGHIWRFAGLDPTSKWEKGERRPWNAELKTLCWKLGQSFMKFSNHEDCAYGAVYRKRKEYEIARNERGENAGRSAEILAGKRWKPSTDAYKAYAKGILPAAHIDAQARRYAVKLFLSHLQTVWWFLETQTLPPKPYALGHLDHAHFIRPQHTDRVAGLDEAMRAAGL